MHSRAQALTYGGSVQGLATSIPRLLSHLVGVWGGRVAGQHVQQVHAPAVAPRLLLAQQLLQRFLLQHVKLWYSGHSLACMGMPRDSDRGAALLLLWTVVASGAEQALVPERCLHPSPFKELVPAGRVPGKGWQVLLQCVAAATAVHMRGLASAL